MDYVGDKAVIGTILAGAGGIAVGGGLGYIAGKRSNSKKSKSRKKHKSGSSRKRDNSYRARKQKKPYTAGKRKDTSHRRIRYTKNNQPYVILGNGRARFISKKSVRRSRKLKGGKY